MKRNEPVTRIMTTTVVTVHTGQRLSEVRKAMTDGRFHHVPVVSGKKLLGMLSATDLLRVTYEYGVDDRQNDTVLDHTVAIRELMTTTPITIRDTATIRDAVGILAEGKFHSLPVVNGDGELAGLVTTTDILRYLLEQY
jgi:CBS-domain-containing membrane protein